MCTGIQLRARDNSVIHARTMDFVIEADYRVVAIPRGFRLTGAFPGGGAGMSWNAEYAAVGPVPNSTLFLADGVNEKGLGGGMFYLPEYARYQDVSASDAPTTIASYDVLTWILTTCATADDVRARLPQVKVANVSLDQLGFVPPLHYLVHDRAGEALVIEYIGGTLRIHDNPLGAIANSPPFDWHVTNLGNYLNLSAMNVSPVDVGNLEIAASSQGSGLRGLPGDYTSSSRFVRAVMFSRAALPPANALEAVEAAFHILNNVNIPKGAVRARAEGGAEEYDYTQWTAAADLKMARYYFHTYHNRRIRSIDLMALPIDGRELVAVPMSTPEDILSVSAAPADPRAA